MSKKRSGNFDRLGSIEEEEEDKREGRILDNPHFQRDLTQQLASTYAGFESSSDDDDEEEYGVEEIMNTRSNNDNNSTASGRLRNIAASQQQTSHLNRSTGSVGTSSSSPPNNRPSGGILNISNLSNNSAAAGARGRPFVVENNNNNGDFGASTLNVDSSDFDNDDSYSADNMSEDRPPLLAGSVRAVPVSASVSSISSGNVTPSGHLRRNTLPNNDRIHQRSHILSSTTSNNNMGNNENPPVPVYDDPFQVNVADFSRSFGAQFATEIQQRSTAAGNHNNDDDSLPLNNFGNGRLSGGQNNASRNHLPMNPPGFSPIANGNSSRGGSSSSSNQGSSRQAPSVVRRVAQNAAAAAAASGINGGGVVQQNQQGVRNGGRRSNGAASADENVRTFSNATGAPGVGQISGNDSREAASNRSAQLSAALHENPVLPANNTPSTILNTAAIISLDEALHKYNWMRQMWHYWVDDIGDRLENVPLYHQIMFDKVYQCVERNVTMDLDRRGGFRLEDNQTITSVNGSMHQIEAAAAAAAQNAGGIPMDESADDLINEILNEGLNPRATSQQQQSNVVDNVVATSESSSQFLTLTSNNINASKIALLKEVHTVKNSIIYNSELYDRKLAVEHMAVDIAFRATCAFDSMRMWNACTKADYDVMRDDAVRLLNFETENVTPFRKMTLYLTGRLAAERLCRGPVPRELYYQSWTKATSTTPSRPTFYWEILCSMKEWIKEATALSHGSTIQEINSAVNSTSSMKSMVEEWLVKHADEDELMTIKRQPALYSFNNGLFDTIANTFANYDSEAFALLYTGKTICAEKFFPIEFNTSGYDADITGQYDPNQYTTLIKDGAHAGEMDESAPKPEFHHSRIDVPYFDDFMKAQGWSPKVEFFFCVMHSRLCKPLRDNFQVAIFIEGMAGTGKSTIFKWVQFVTADDALGVISADGEKQFGLQEFLDDKGNPLKRVMIMFDMNKTCTTLSPSTINSIITGEAMSVARKNIAAAITKAWKIAFGVAGNEFFKFEPGAMPALMRRWLIFIANNRPESQIDSNANGDDIMLPYVGEYLKKTTLAERDWHHSLQVMVQKGNKLGKDAYIWKHVPEYFHINRRIQLAKPIKLLRMLIDPEWFEKTGNEADIVPLEYFCFLLGEYFVHRSKGTSGSKWFLHLDAVENSFALGFPEVTVYNSKRTAGIDARVAQRNREPNANYQHLVSELMSSKFNGPFIRGFRIGVLPEVRMKCIGAVKIFESNQSLTNDPENMMNEAVTRSVEVLRGIVTQNNGGGGTASSNVAGSFNNSSGNNVFRFSSGSGGVAAASNGGNSSNNNNSSYRNTFGRSSSGNGNGGTNNGGGGGGLNNSNHSINRGGNNNNNGNNSRPSFPRTVPSNWDDVQEESFGDEM